MKELYRKCIMVSGKLFDLVEGRWNRELNAFVKVATHKTNVPYAICKDEQKKIDLSKLKIRITNDKDYLAIVKFETMYWDELVAYVEDVFNRFDLEREKEKNKELGIRSLYIFKDEKFGCKFITIEKTYENTHSYMNMSTSWGDIRIQSTSISELVHIRTLLNNSISPSCDDYKLYYNQKNHAKRKQYMDEDLADFLRLGYISNVSHVKSEDLEIKKNADFYFTNFFNYPEVELEKAINKMAKLCGQR